jgi:hypothetical protein
MDTTTHIDGPTAVRSYLERDGRKAKWLARECSVRPEAVSHWLSGSYRPAPGAREKLSGLTGVNLRPDECWPRRVEAAE